MLLTNALSNFFKNRTMIRNLRSRSLELQFGIHFTHIVGSVSDGPFIHIQKFPDTVSSHRSRISDHKRRHQLLVELKIYTYDAVIFRQMVAYKRKIAQDDRFLASAISYTNCGLPSNSSTLFLDSHLNGVNILWTNISVEI